jgi:large subunit ribosomal protein L9
LQPKLPLPLRKKLPKPLLPKKRLLNEPFYRNHRELSTPHFFYFVMKIILRETVESVGNVGEIVTVKNGYARNFLIPRGLAYYASPKAIRILDSEKKVYEAKMAKLKVEAELLAAKLAETQVSIAMQAGEEDRLFGSVTNVMIAQELATKGFTIDRRTIVIDEPIRKLGNYEVKVKLHPEVVALVKVWVTSAA